jgi:putative iron-regulated protein
MTQTAFALGVLALAAGIVQTARAQTAAVVIDTYTDIAQAVCEDIMTAASTLNAAVPAFIDAPAPESLQAARTAWIAARVP